LIFPGEFGAELPTFESLPEDFQSVIESYRIRKAGKLVLATYREFRIS
jgi:hypothetical protein